MSLAAARARVVAVAAVAAVAAAGCLEAGRPPVDRVECAIDDDCRRGEGEVCDDGVCWGDPPDARFAAVLGPPAGYSGLAVATELAELDLDDDGWFDDGRSAGLTLASAVRVSGQVRAPCPPAPAIDPCSGSLAVPGALRWARRSAIQGLPDVVVPTAMQLNSGGGGFEVFLPRPGETTTYTVTFTPSTAPLGPGLPSPASFLPPYRASVTIGPGEGSELVRDVTLPGAPRTLSGQIVVAGGSAAGWRVHAEAGDGTVQGALTLASSVATTSATGEFSLALIDDEDVVDLVFEPTALPGGEVEPPRVRLRDHVVTAALPVLTLPPVERLIAVPVTVTGTDGSGAQAPVSGATVVARLDQPMGAVFLRHQATATTAGGVASLQLLLGSEATPLRYQLHVLPGPTSQLASVHGVELAVAGVVPTAAVQLPLGRALVGKVLDEHGFGLPGATVTAAIATATLCELTSDSLRVARDLAPVQATTNSKGEFTLFVDPDLGETSLRYDLAVAPAAGAWAPRWTFPAQPLSNEHRELWLPAAAHVRARVLDPTGAPAGDTVVTLYEVTDKPAPCAIGTQGSGGQAIVRAVATSGPDGLVRAILPRLDD